MKIIMWKLWYAGHHIDGPLAEAIKIHVDSTFKLTSKWPFQSFVVPVSK